MRYPKPHLYKVGPFWLCRIQWYARYPYDGDISYVDSGACSSIHIGSTPQKAYKQFMNNVKYGSLIKSYYMYMIGRSLCAE